MRTILPVVSLLIVLALAACSGSGRQRASAIARADALAGQYPDSALAMTRDIDPSELKDDSIKAKYYVVAATAHKALETSMASDSLTRFAYEYYRHRDTAMAARSGDLYAMHLFWNGNGQSSLAILDSLIALPGLPDRVMQELLKSRIGIGGAEYDCARNIPHIKRMLAIDKSPEAQLYYKYELNHNYAFSGHSDSALMVIDDLIAYAKANDLGSERYQFTYEKIGILEELGRYEESNVIADYILDHDPHPSAIPYLRYWKSLNHFNMGHFDLAARELAVADSIAAARDDVDYSYYESFAGHLRDIIEYRKTGKLSLNQLAKQNNGQKDRIDRMETIRREAETDALRAENKALLLKAQNERKTAIAIIAALTALLATLTAAWSSQKRKRKIIEAEERAEALQKMVDDMKSTATPAEKHDRLRHAMLQQIGIIKMVAEAPTEQNRDMLRKISSIDGDTNGSLVNWPHVYEAIDNLYDNFHARLHDRHGDRLTEKEEQIIVLMVAGFSTKEIGVITAQTTATVYVRKSSARKKLGVPEKEDIVAFLHSEEASLSAH